MFRDIHLDRYKDALKTSASLPNSDHFGILRGFSNAITFVPGETSYGRRRSQPFHIGFTHGDIQRKWKSLRIAASVSTRMKKSLQGRRRQSLASVPVAEAVSRGFVEEDADKPDVEHEPKRQITDARQKSLAGKFQMCVKIVIMCMKTAGTHILQTMAYDDASAFLCLLNFHDCENDDAGPLFDPKKFKANKQLRLTEDMKHVLCKLPHDRTQTELDCAHVFLRNIQAYADYPATMQKHIVRVGRYEKFEPKRVIIRQGHLASAFYFILSGSVIVLVADKDSPMSRPMAYLSRGATFGELAIINRSTRSSTVITKETTELLSVDAEDFRQIFMCDGIKDITDPADSDLIQNLTFLKNWPTEKLKANPGKCMYHYFKRGEIIVKDSRCSDWIIVVKSGSVCVLKKLKRVTPFGTTKPDTSYDTKKGYTRNLRQGTVPPRFVEDELKQAGTPRTKQRTLPRMPVLQEVRFGVSECVLATDEGEQGTGQGEKADAANLLGNQRSRAVDGKKTGHYFTCSRQRHRGQRANVTLTDIGANTSTGRQNSKTHKGGGEHDVLQVTHQMIRTFSDDINARCRTPDPDELTAADVDPQFVRIDTLTRGHMFGLADTLLEGQPRVSLVSSAAECILIDKQFYREHAPKQLIDSMRLQLNRYPDDEELQQQLQDTVDWHAFRRHQLMTTVQLVQRRSANFFTSRTLSRR